MVISSLILRQGEYWWFAQEEDIAKFVGDISGNVSTVT